MRKVALAMLLSGCVVPPNDCVTACGMGVRGFSDCSELNAYEAVGVEAFSYLYDALCQRLDSVVLQVKNTPDGSWVDEFGRKVDGLTWCDLAFVEVGNSNWQTNAYFHELAHVAQCPFQDSKHETWEGLGIWSHLDALKASFVENNQAAPDDLTHADVP